MIIKQPYIDSTGKKQVREIEIKLEDLRSLDEPINQATLVAHPRDEPNNSVYINPTEHIVALLDAKRTMTPYQRHQSYLTQPYEGEFVVADPGPRGLNVRSGDPLVIMSDLDGTDLDYFLASEVKGRVITPGPVPTFQYRAGAIVQNLANRWWGHPLGGELGVAARLNQPEPVPFAARKDGDSISVIVTTPINTSKVKFYDVYVRKLRFSYIEPHWMPDAADVDISQDEVIITTYGGGKPAGGGQIGDGSYHVAVVSKDRSGRANVNESRFTTEAV